MEEAATSFCSVLKMRPIAEREHQPLLFTWLYLNKHCKEVGISTDLQEKRSGSKVSLFIHNYKSENKVTRKTKIEGNLPKSG